MTATIIRFPLDEETPDELLARMSGALRDVIVIGVTLDGALEYDWAGDLTFDQALGRIEMAKAIWVAAMLEAQE